MYQYGHKVVTLSRSVDNFCLKQGNDKPRAYPMILKMGEDIAKDLFRTTIWEIKQAALQVCNGYITLPRDCQKMLSIMIVDEHNRLHPLSFNPNINTFQMNCVQDCSCTNCHGQNTLCSVNDSITVTTELVDIQGTEYPKTIYTRVNGDGSITRHENTPAFNASTESVVYNDSYQTIDNVQVDTKGCVVNNPLNVQKLRECCGYTNPYLGWDVLGLYREKLLPPANVYGHWNWAATAKDMIKIVGCVSKVVISYECDPEYGGGELIIPEYAEFALHTGIMYHQALYNSQDRDRSNTRLNSYRLAKLNLNKYLMPIRQDNLMMLQTHLRQW